MAQIEPAQRLVGVEHFVDARCRSDWRVKAVAADVLLFKKKMNDNMVLNGVVIRVWGVGDQSTVCTTISPDTWKWIVPDDWKAKTKVATTVPLYWTVTPRQ